MWQKNNKKFHLVLKSELMQDGCIAECACGYSFHMDHKKLIVYVDPEKHCVICDGIWRLVCTSIDDARNSLRSIDNIKVIQRAAELASQVTLKKMLEAKVRKLEREESHARV